MTDGQPIVVNSTQFVGWLEAAKDPAPPPGTVIHGMYRDGEWHTGPAAVEALKAAVATNNAALQGPVDRLPIVRCGECTAVNGHFPDCAKAARP